MKNKKIIIGLALGVGAYLLWNMKRKKSTGVVEEIKETVESISETGGIKPSKTELTNEQVRALFERANNYYRGGARPSQDLIDSIKEKRDIALSEINRLGLYTEFSAWRKKENFKTKNLMPPMSIDTMQYVKPILLK